MMRSPTVLLMSQVYVPDPAAVGQQLHDAAVEMARRGYRVRVLTSSRGYDSPEVRFPPRETIDGVSVWRLPFSSFGKKSLCARIAGQMCFLLQVIVRGLFTPQIGAVLFSTSPPMCSAAALAVAAIRRVPIVYWVMDINPDQAVALGLVSPKSLMVRAFSLLNRAVLGRAHNVVTLDRFMAERLLKKSDVNRKLDVFPPWPHEDHLAPVDHERNPFRRKHCLEGRFVVMHSGNHSISHPIATVIEAAQRLEDRKDVVFVFVGGGRRKKEVDDAVAAGASNIVSLPYQPLSELRYSLSAADVHLVTVGDAMVGIVHPSKIYGAMAVARPILLLSPAPSHATDILRQRDIGRHVEHGDVEGAVHAITELADMSPWRRAVMGRTARRFVRDNLSKDALCGRFADILVAAVNRTPLPQRHNRQTIGPVELPDARRTAA